MIAKGGGLYATTLRDSLTIVLQNAGAFSFGSPLAGAGLTLLSIAGILTWRRIRITLPQLQAYMVWAAIFTVIYAISGLRQIDVDQWYLMPLTPAYCLMLWIGSDTVLDRLRPTLRMAGFILLGLLILSTQLSGLTWRRTSAYPALAPIPLTGPEREAGYRAVCHALAPHLTINSRFAHFPGWFHDLVPRTRVMTNVMPNPAPEYPVVGPHEQVRPIGVIMSPTMHFNIWHITERGYHI